MYYKVELHRFTSEINVVKERSKITKDDQKDDNSLNLAEFR